MAKFLGGPNLFSEDSSDKPTDILGLIIKTEIQQNIKSFQPSVAFHIKASLCSN